MSNPKRTTRLKLEEFVNRSDVIHQIKYNYSKVEYVNNKTKVCIICPEHGEFHQLPKAHLEGQGCPKCVGFNKDTKEIIQEFKTTHNNAYNYDLVEYVKAQDEIRIICPEHGEFLQRAYAHLQGQGCPTCNISKGEIEVSRVLEKYNIIHTQQQTFSDCKNVRKLPFDFYIPSIGVLIEYDGRQHFEVTKHFGGVEGFKRRKFNDNIKTQYAKDNNIRLLRIAYSDYNNIEELILNL